jgi:hypothetical protein
MRDLSDMLSTLLVVSLAVSPTAQDLANATRQLESVRATKEPSEALEKEVRELTDAWVREETKLTRGMALESRVSRYFRLLELSSSGPSDLRGYVEDEAKDTFIEWLNQGDSLLQNNKPVRVLALRKQFVRAVGTNSKLVSLRADLDSKARQTLQSKTEPFEKYAYTAAESLVDDKAVSIPNELTRFRFLKEAPKIESACASENPKLSFRSDGIESQSSVKVGSCSPGFCDETASRSLQYEDTVMVDKTEEYVSSMRTETYTVSSPCGETCATENMGTNGNGGIIMRTTCTPKFCDSVQTKEVPVYSTRTVQVPEIRSFTENYTETVRTFSVSASVSILIDGDGTRIDKTLTAQGRVVETQFSTVHGKSASFSGNGEARVLKALKEDIELQFEKQVNEFNIQRGKAILSKATSLGEFVKAAILMREIPPALANRLDKEIGLLPSELPILLEPHKATLVEPIFSLQKKAGIELPPPDKDLNQRLATYENKVETVYRQGGYFGGIELGVAVLESNERNGHLRFGFGASATFAIMPPFTVKIPLFLRLVANPSGSAVGHVHFNGILRAEVGIRVRNFVLAAVGAGQFQWTLFTGPNRSADTFAADEHFSTPLSVAYGYGAFLRIPFSFMSFQSAGEDAPSFTITPGLDVLALRLHQSDPTIPFGVRAEAKLFLDFGSIARVTASVIVNSQDDVPQFFSGHYRQFICALGIHSDF